MLGVGTVLRAGRSARREDLLPALDLKAKYGDHDAFYLVVIIATQSESGSPNWRSAPYPSSLPLPAMGKILLEKLSAKKG